MPQLGVKMDEHPVDKQGRMPKSLGQLFIAK